MWGTESVAWIPSALLLVSAAISAGSFIAQSSAMRSIGPLWYLGIRFLLAAAVIAPLAIAEFRRVQIPISFRTWLLVTSIGATLLGAALSQQIALMLTTVTRAGFLTSLYIVFTPWLALAFLGSSPRTIVWLMSVVAVLGAWLLQHEGTASANVGEMLLILGALGWAARLVLVDRLLRTIPMPFLVVLSQSLFVGVIACILALTIEPLGRNAIAGAAWEPVYGGVIAAAVGYLIQVVAQAHVTAPTAAVLLSAEAPFAALFGVLVNGDQLNATSWVGCGLIFLAVLLVQLNGAVSDIGSNPARVGAKKFEA